MGGIITPNYGQMGTEMLPTGTGPVLPYGSTPAPATGVVQTGTMHGGTDSALSNIGYRPTSGRADRLPANIVGGGGVGKF